jgi:invasion protein IalB
MLPICKLSGLAAKAVLAIMTLLLALSTLVAETDDTSEPDAGAAAFEAEEYDDWHVICFEPMVQGVRCQITQALVETRLQQIIVVASVAFVPDADRALVQIALPGGFVLGEGARLNVGDINTQLAVSRCTRRGCLVEGILTPDIITAFQREREASIIVAALGDQLVRIGLSLMGFTKAFDTMRDRNLASHTARGL